MSVNLIDVIKNAFTDNVYDKISRNVDVDRNTAKTGVEAIIPMVLASILGKNATASANEPAWWRSLTDLFRRDEDDLSVDILNDPKFSETGRNVLGGLFGSNQSSIVDVIAKKIGLTGDKASGLLGAVVPLVTGFLANWTRKKGWSFGDLISNLTENKSAITSALPATLASSLFGLSAFGQQSKEAVRKIEPTRANTTPTHQPRKKNNLLWILLLLIAVALLVWLFGKGCTKKTTVEETQAPVVVQEEATPTVAETIKGSLNEAGDWVYDLGQSISLKLKDGKELMVGENSVENRLVRFIESNDPVDKTTWFSFDRLYFETGSTNLKKESQEQLQNIADIMKAYPAVNLKVGGYTDNTGSEDGNMKLSQQRAETAMNELVKLGVDKARMEAEGYGSQHAIASNDTPEGRAQNRRIDVRVTKK